MDGKKFDLNIEKILEDWEVFHGIREVVANALDEELITKTETVEIFKDNENNWHVRDHGRGLKYEHLTQKECDEKLQNENVIGKFGIGLKDALATFDRKNVNILIKSQFGDITIEKSEKHDFEELFTLHAVIHPPSDPSFIGTDVIISNCTDKDIEKAKNLFLRFSGEKTLESTKYGEILEKKSDKSTIYVNGVKVAEEDNFLFSYNITSLTKDIRKALNRERTNVGRSAYSNRIKQMLLQCSSDIVASSLVNDLQNYDKGTTHDELSWQPVAIHACRILNAQKKTVFLATSEIINASDLVDKARRDDYEVINIPETIKEKISGLTDISGSPIRDIMQFQTEWNESFKFTFITEYDMTSQEKTVFNRTKDILDLIGGKPREVKEIKISETMRIESGSFFEATGLWDSANNRIIVKRSQLSSINLYAGTLLHEIGHILSRASDVSRDFETELTRIIGTLVTRVIRK